MTIAVGDEGPRRDRQLYGRRISRPLSDQLARLIATRLPAFRLDLNEPPPQPLSALFAAPVREIWLEIGFGGGEHLLWQAQAHPQTGLLGCEPFLNGVAKVLRGADESELGNLRLYDDDARHVLQWLPEGSLSRVFLLFPDPWPKTRHRKRRFLTEEGLAMLARVMRTGAELRFATDIADYAATAAKAVKAQGDFFPEPGLLADRPPDWPLTRYAQKAIAAGRACQFFIFRRTESG